MSDTEYRYSELFKSIQGEGHYTGIPTLWLRLWGCNLECNGFGQKDPSDPDTYILPHLDFDPTTVSSMEDLPVWTTGCDSSYSWSKQFRKLAHKDTAEGIADKLTGLLRTPYNTEGTFLHEKSNLEMHMAFTGGEPMMNQPAMVAVMNELARRENPPRFITIETNGTKPIKQEFADMIYNFYQPAQTGGMIPPERGPAELFWSVSPKLSASGEPWAKAIQPEVVGEYSRLFDRGQLKFVVDGSEKTWYEVDKAVEAFRNQDVDWPVWIMPVGADTTMQEQNAEVVALGAIDRGFNVSARVHTYIFGNKIGT